MTRKTMLSLATIAILSGVNAAADELKVDTSDENKLKLGANAVTGSGGAYTVSGSAVEIKSDLTTVNGGLNKLTIEAGSNAVSIGEAAQSAALTFGGTSDKGYAFDITANSLSTAGASAQATTVNVNQNSSITTTNGATIGENSSINISEGKTLTVGGGLTNSGTISIGKGTLIANGALTSSTGSITLGGGTLTANGKTTIDGTKLTLSDGGVLNFNGTGTANASSITGATSSTAGKTLTINLAKDASLNVDDLTLTNNTDSSLDKITLGGGTLSGKLTANATNLDTTAGGVIDFNKDGSNIKGDLTINSGTELKFSSTTNTTGTTFENLNAQGSSKLNFAQAGAKVSVGKLNANASNIDMSQGGDLTLSDDSKISGNLSLSKGNISLSTGKTLDTDSVNLTDDAKISLKGGTLNVASGLTTKGDSATKDKNLDLADGGTINFNGASSTLGGKTETTTAKDTKFNVKNGSNVSFDELTLSDEKGILTLESGVVNVNKLTANKNASLALKSGTLNFKAGTQDNKNASEIKEKLTFNTDSNVNLNFEGHSEVTFTEGIDLSENKGKFDVQKDALVKLGTAGDKELKAGEITLGGSLQASKLSAATSIDSKKLNVNFGDNAKISIEGSLGDTAKFTLGTKENADNTYKNFLGETGETISVKSAGNVLSLDSGDINANVELKTEGGGTIRFNGGSLNVNSKLTIDDSATGLEFAEGKSGNLNFNTGASEFTKGNLNLTDSSVNINIANGASLEFKESSSAGIKGNGNAVNLGKYAQISVDGEVSGLTKLEGSGAITGNLSLAKNTTLGISTTKDNDGTLQEISTGKITAADTKDGATLAFGTGSVNLKGGTESASLKLNNEGFASALQLAENAVFDINRGTINVKGALSVATGKAATVKVSNATANFNGGFAATDYVKKFELNGGTINVKGDFTGADLDVAHVQTNANGISSSFNISGSADIQNSKFAIVPLVETGATSYKVLSAKSLSQSDNTGEFRVRASVKQILDKYGLEADNAAQIKDEDKIVDAVDSSVTVEVKADKTSLYLERKIDTSSLRTVKAKSIQADIDALNALLADTDIVETANKDKVLETALKTLNANKTSAESQSNSELASELGGANADILLSAFGSKTGFGAESETRNAIAIDITKNGGQGLVKDIKENAASSANMASSTSSIMNVMNLSNDMSIGGRIAAANNPFGNYASLDGLKFAAVSGDMPLYYANNGFENGFWANAIGGLNQIEGESGTLYGLSLGFDKQLDSTLLGFYLSYAMANLNDKTVEQGSQNIQVGLYASFNQRDIEVNVKAYGQTAITETTAYRGADEQNTAEAKFNRLFAGFSANVGAIFAFNQNKTFIKPFVGENYYYAHTPAYKESGVAALDVASANNHALSFDVGVDVRHYLGENSFIYLTPSVERYVVNSGADFTAGFVGSDTSFTIEGKSSTKTYAQALIGGNIALGDKFNVNLGFGAKKILTGEVENAEGDKKDELYLSGNLGLKYRF